MTEVSTFQLAFKLGIVLNDLGVCHPPFILIQQLLNGRFIQAFFQQNRFDCITKLEYCIFFITDIPASSSDIPDYFLPVAEFKVTQCSKFAVVCRLKSNEFTLTSEGKVLSLPEHPLFNVSIPENAVPKGEEHRVVVKVS